MGRRRHRTWSTAQTVGDSASVPAPTAVTAATTSYSETTKAASGGPAAATSAAEPSAVARLVQRC